MNKRGFLKSTVVKAATNERIAIVHSGQASTPEVNLTAEFPEVSL